MASLTSASSGVSLIQSKAYLDEVEQTHRNFELAGQELNGSTWAICKMDLILHGIKYIRY